MTDVVDGWIEHDGGPCPVSPDTRVFVRFMDGLSDEGHQDGAETAGWWSGSWRSAGNDRIIAYRLVEVGAMSKIDWDRPLEAYHEDGRAMEIKMEKSPTKEIWTTSHLGCPSVWNMDGTAWDPAEQGYGWTIRNKAEPKADIEAWAIKRAEEILYVGNMADVLNNLARYVMTKEDAPIDPDLIAAREVVCGYHHDKHPESPWHMEMAEQVRSGDRDGGPVMLVAYHAIKRGRELERGEGK